MRIVSWNVWWRFGDAWRRRQQGILQTLRWIDPDVIGLQESWAGPGDSQPGWLARELGMDWAFASPSLPPPPAPPESPDQAGFEVGVAVMSRWAIADVRREVLPAVHREPPVALIATLAHPRGPLHVIVSCVEWEPAHMDDHMAQTRALAAIAQDPSLDGPLPVFVAADLNAAPGTPQIRSLTDAMVDAWSVAGGGDAATLATRNPLAPRDAPAQIDRRIDYVLARPGRPGGRIRATRAFVVDEPVGGMFPSDHFPVVVDVDE